MELLTVHVKEFCLVVWRDFELVDLMVHAMDSVMGDVMVLLMVHLMDHLLVYL